MSTTKTQQAVPGIPAGPITVDEFEELVDSLGDERVELIDGHVLRSGDTKPAHVLVVGLLSLVRTRVRS
jgi:hypothetical protein